MNAPQTQHRNRDPLGHKMIIAAWIIGFVLLSWLINNWYEQRNQPNRHIRISESRADTSLTLHQDPQGHYRVPGRINGHDVNFLLDTGASDVAIPAITARRLGLEGKIESQAHTANGTARIWLTRIDNLRIGGIKLVNLSASIIPAMKGEEILLGMSALRHLELVQRGNELTLRVPRDKR